MAPPSPAVLSESTVVRLPRGASSRAKDSGWMLIPIRETTHGCCREWSMLASWRNSEKLFMASMARRCLSIVSGWWREGLLQGGPGSRGLGGRSAASCQTGLLRVRVRGLSHGSGHQTQPLPSGAKEALLDLTLLVQQSHPRRTKASVGPQHWAWNP